MLPNGITVIRDENYFQTHYNRDKNLSLKAKGLLGLIYSLPPSWDFSIKGLITICKEEEAAIRSAIRELRDLGYCEYARIRNEKQQLQGTHYIFYEKPKKPNVDFPHEEKPNEENPPQYNKEVLNNITKKKEGGDSPQNGGKDGGKTDTKRIKAPLPDSVLIWLEKMQIEITQAGVELIKLRVTNLACWKQTLDGWLASGWTKNNIDGQLNRYTKKLREGDFTEEEKEIDSPEDTEEKTKEDEILRRLIYGNGEK